MKIYLANLILATGILAFCFWIKVLSCQFVSRDASNNSSIDAVTYDLLLIDFILISLKLMLRLVIINADSPSPMPNPIERDFMTDKSADSLSNSKKTFWFFSARGLGKPPNWLFTQF